MGILLAQIQSFQRTSQLPVTARLVQYNSVIVLQAYDDKNKESGEDVKPISTAERYRKSLIIGGSGLLGAAAYGIGNLQNRLAAQARPDYPYPVVATTDIMVRKAHGTSDFPVQDKLRWNCDSKLADRICNYNRNWAEFAGYWTSSELSFLSEMDKMYLSVNGDDSAGTLNAPPPDKPMQFYDSVTGKLLFTAPIGRSYAAWRDESMVHGWPSFRDNEVNWENVRTLKDGETVSLTGTHLGHNIPDRRGNRYCINLVSIAGNPTNA
eukprot:CAMPEP_0174956576 /NCGR_PEP_ID=MMETSP0004_2-20121128/1604_1 /TAXON_ID=420556 /ORGANISM="Ochromonas sp., Strain CCMP1393" /LENGTH=265 /DNA_ID=CAMNT_0016204611 /DNA_START=46 /DNA_END=843 /DNA_ORIENTATION=+